MSTKNTTKCPICRRDSSISLKLIYDIKFDSINQQNNRSSTIQSTQDIMKQNKKLSYQNEILKAQVEEMKEKQGSIQKQIDESINEFMEMKKTNKEYKNKALLLTFQLRESEDQCNLLKEELSKCHERFMSFEKELKEKAEIIESNKTVGCLLDRNLKDKNIQDIIKELIDKKDNGRALNEYVYILQQRIDTLEEENERIKRSNKINQQEPLIKQVDSSTLITMIGNPINSKKRKYRDFLLDKDLIINHQEVKSDFQKSQNTTNNSKQNIVPADIQLNTNQSNSNNTIRLFNNPFNQKKGISFVNQNYNK